MLPVLSRIKTTLFQRLTVVFMVGLASCLLAAGQYESELLPDGSSISYETQINSPVSNASSNFGLALKKNLTADPLHLVAIDLVSDYLPPLTSEASSFLHLKQRPQFEPIELGAKPWLTSSKKLEVEYHQIQPVPWFINNWSSHSSRISGWKESNLSFNKHIYFI